MNINPDFTLKLSNGDELILTQNPDGFLLLEIKDPSMELKSSTPISTTNISDLGISIRALVIEKSKKK